MLEVSNPPGELCTSVPQRVKNTRPQFLIFGGDKYLKEYVTRDAVFFAELKLSQQVSLTNNF